MKGIICELQICLTRESEKWCRKTVKVCKSLLQYKTSIHIHCLGQGLFRQAIHAPFLHNIHTVKEPRFGKRSDSAVLSQSMHEPPANKTSVYIRCLGQGLIRQAIHTPVLLYIHTIKEPCFVRKSQSRSLNSNYAIWLCPVIPQRKYSRFKTKHPWNVIKLLKHEPSEMSHQKGLSHFEHRVLLHGNQCSMKGSNNTL